MVFERNYHRETTLKKLANGPTIKPELASIFDGNEGTTG